MALIVRAPPPDTTGGISHLTVLTPILPGRRDPLVALVEGWNGNSPFAVVATLHHARVTVLDSLQIRRRHVRLDPPYLLFAAAVDGTVDGLVEDLATKLPDACDALWGHCGGYPGCADGRRLRQYVTEHRVVADLAFATFTASVDEVRQALALKDALGALLERKAQLSADALRKEVEALS